MVGNTLQNVLPRVFEREPRCRRQILHGLGHENLAWAGKRSDSGPDVHGYLRTRPPRSSTSPEWTPARILMPNGRSRSEMLLAHSTASAGPSSVARSPSPELSM